MGRKKISIQRIEGERERQVTYGKRKMGMINKATELAVLTDAQVGLIVFGSNGKMTIYSSAPLEYIIARYRKHKDAPEVRLAARPQSSGAPAATTYAAVSRVRASARLSPLQPQPRQSWWRPRRSRRW